MDGRAVLNSTLTLRGRRMATVVSLLACSLLYADDRVGMPPPPINWDPINAALRDPAKTEKELAAAVVDGLRERIRLARRWADDGTEASKQNAWGRYYDEGSDLMVFVHAAMKPRSVEQRGARIDALEAACAQLRDEERAGPLGTCLDIAQAVAGGRNARVDAALVRAASDRAAPRRIVGWAVSYVAPTSFIEVLPRLLELMMDEWEAPYGMHGEGRYFPIRAAAVERLNSGGIKVVWRRDAKDGYVKVFDLNYSEDKYAQVDRSDVLSALRRSLEDADANAFAKGVAASKQIGGIDVKELLLALSRSEALVEARRKTLASTASEIR